MRFEHHLAFLDQIEAIGVVALAENQLAGGELDRHRVGCQLLELGRLQTLEKGMTRKVCQQTGLAGVR